MNIGLQYIRYIEEYIPKLHIHQQEGAAVHQKSSKKQRNCTSLVIKPEAKQDKKSWVFSYEDLQSMHYLHASIDKLMRLYPSVLLDSKHALHNDVMPDGTIVRKGTRMSYHPYAMGRRDAI